MQHHFNHLNRIKAASKKNKSIDPKHKLPKAPARAKANQSIDK
jgi:hypothetical protein